jgi:hypothetical protein
MAELERSEQELTPGYYENQFANRVGSITKAGAAPPGPSGGTSTGGGCLKGGGGIVFGAVLLIRLLIGLGSRDSTTPKYNTYPSYSQPSQAQPMDPALRGQDDQWNGGFRQDDNNALPARPGKQFPPRNRVGVNRPWDKQGEVPPPPPPPARFPEKNPPPDGEEPIPDR